MQSLRREILLPLLLLSVALSSAVLTGLFRMPFTPGESLEHQIGTNDFVAYWGAYQAARASKDPYSRDTIFEIQKTLPLETTEIHEYWNPPWTLFILSPILSHDFQTSVSLWFVLSVCFLIGASVTSWKLATRTRVRPLWCGLSGFLFVPVWHCLKNGQLSIFVAFLLFSLAIALKERREILAGILLALLTLKAHILYLYLGALVIFLIKEKRFVVFLASLVTLGIIGIGTYALLPISIAAWRAQEHLPYHWMTPTLGSIIRFFIFTRTGETPIWPLYTVPLVTALLVAPFVWRRINSVLDLSLIVPLTTLSLITAPYGWIFDQSLLLVIPVSIVAWSFSAEVTLRKRVIAYFMLFLLQFFTVIMRHYLEFQYQFVWYPVVTIALWYVLTWLFQMGPYERASDLDMK